MNNRPRIRATVAACYREPGDRSPAWMQDMAELQAELERLWRIEDVMERIARTDYRGNMPVEVAMAKSVLDKNL